MTPVERCLAEREPPLLWVHEAAAPLEGVSVESMRTDAGALSRALETAADLLGLPAVATSFDTTLEAEAAGCAVADGEVEGFVRTEDDAFGIDPEEVVDGGRIPVVLDATDRLVANLRDASALGGLTGPRRLADDLLADADPAPAVLDETTFAATDVVMAVANAYVERGVDGVLVLEPDGVGEADRYLDAATPLLNLLDHYDRTAVLAQRTVTAGDVETAGSLGFDAITGRVPEVESARSAAEEGGIALGVGVPTERLLDGDVEAFLDGLPDDALVSSEWSVPEGTSPETLHRIMGSMGQG